jgi:hypothetical protein
MTQKVYRTAMGKTIDMGQLMLENEQIRAVGNMNVNARGDLLDGANRVIDTKPKQVQRQYDRQSVPQSAKIPISNGTVAVKKQRAANSSTTASLESVAFSSDPVVLEIPPAVAVDDPAAVDSAPQAEEASAPTPVETPAPIARGGLAAAIAKSRTVAQQKEKTPRQLAQSISGVRKI